MRRVALAALALLAGACAARSARPAPGLVVFMSDFGTSDDSVAIAKGVMLEAAPDLRLVDLTHEVPPFSIREGARLLAGAAPHFAPGSVFLCVVDPGVGSTRKPIVARARSGRMFVLPDNGLLTLLAESDPVIEVREIENPRFMRGAALSSTFHGRDVFAPAAAMLARGERFDDVGPVLADWVQLSLARARLAPEGIAGEVVALDGPYGNLVTDIDADLFRQLGYAHGQTVPVRIGDKAMRLPFVRTFSDVAAGDPLLYLDSRGRMGIALNKGHFARAHGITPPLSIVILAKEKR